MVEQNHWLHAGGAQGNTVDVCPAKISFNDHNTGSFYIADQRMERSVVKLPGRPNLGGRLRRGSYGLGVIADAVFVRDNLELKQLILRLKVNGV